MEELSVEVGKVIKPVPFKGIPQFFDISGLLASPHVFEKVIDAMGSLVSDLKPDIICALDARGFLIGAPVSLRLGLPLVMVRKQGKLPGTCLITEFDKEYEKGDSFEIQCGAVKPGDKVVVVDDFLATGGSMKGAFSLIRQSSPASITGVCLMDLFLPGSREFLKANQLEILSLLDVRKWNTEST